VPALRLFIYEQQIPIPTLVDQSVPLASLEAVVHAEVPLRAGSLVDEWSQARHATKNVQRCAV
jgi:hypothetical protein